MKEKISVSKMYGLIGFILSLIGFVALFISLYAGLVLGILGLIFCIIQFKKGKTGLAIAGLVLSILILVNCIIRIIIVIWAYSFLSS